MEELDELFEKFTAQHSQKIQKICEPLREHLDISKLIYYRLDADGTFSLFSNFPELVRYYHEQNLHLTNPMFVHPSLLSKGSVLVPLTRNKFAANEIQKRFLITKVFFVLLNNGDRVEGFLFANPSQDDSFANIIAQNMELLYKFIPYFQDEVNPLVRKMRDKKFNLLKIKGEKFWNADPTVPLSRKNPRAKEFLKELFPLSNREMQCLELYLRGETAQSTAAILGLSQRTVESYFESIKQKLHCSSKSELLQYR